MRPVLTGADLFRLAVAFVLVALAVWAVAEITVFLFGLQASEEPDEVGYACPRCNGALDAYDDGTLECRTCSWPESDIKRVRGAARHREVWAGRRRAVVYDFTHGDGCRPCSRGRAR